MRGLNSEEILSILLNSNVHYRVHKSVSLFLIFSQLNPIHNDSCYFFMIHLLLSKYLRLYLPIFSFNLFLLQLRMTFSPIRFPSHAKVLLHDVIILIIFERCANYGWGFTLCSSLQVCVICCLLNLTTFLWNTLQVSMSLELSVWSLMWQYLRL
jgi:hypothetical protein